MSSLRILSNLHYLANEEAQERMSSLQKSTKNIIFKHIDTVAQVRLIDNNIGKYEVINYFE